MFRPDSEGLPVFSDNILIPALTDLNVRELGRDGRRRRGEEGEGKGKDGVRGQRKNRKRKAKKRG